MDALENIHENVNNWLRFAEAKNGVLVTAAGFAFWGIVRISLTAEISVLEAAYLFQLCLGVLLALISGVLSFLPVTKYSFLIPSNEISESDNLLYFGDLAKYDANRLISELRCREIHDENVNVHLSRMYAEQIIANSRITLTKLKIFTWGFRFLLVGLLTPLIGIPALLIIENTRKHIDGY